ncbi:MAG: hypothetical protein ACI8TQ_003580 [Planctomycetota bacterium]|jgi:hypothetical protein
MSFKRALGARELPDSLQLADGDYRLVQTLQHSFFAATGAYEGPGGKMLFKSGREASLFGFPMRWVGRLLARRELRMYEICSGIEGVPSGSAPVTETSFVRPFVEGRSHVRGEIVDNEFFPRFRKLLDQIHEREMAFVDLQKADNVLIDENGAPWLFDFQIAWHFPAHEKRQGIARFVPAPLGRFLLKRLQTADNYHLLRHWSRSQRETMSVSDQRIADRPSIGIRVHRLILNPWRALRKRLKSNTDSGR